MFHFLHFSSLWATTIANRQAGATAPAKTLARLPHPNQRKISKPNILMATGHHQLKEDPLAIITEKQNSSSHKHTNSISADGQLG
jgi:hypothetical protein